MEKINFKSRDFNKCLLIVISILFANCTKDDYRQDPGLTDRNGIPKDSTILFVPDFGKWYLRKKSRDLMEQIGYWKAATVIAIGLLTVGRRRETLRCWATF